MENFNVYIKNSSVLFADENEKITNECELIPIDLNTNNTKVNGLGFKKCRDYDPSYYLGPRGWKFFSRPATLLNSVLSIILEGRGDLEDNFMGGIYIGSAHSNKNTISTYEYSAKTNGMKSVRVKETPSILANFPAGSIALKSKFRGPNFTFSNGILSGIHALETAVNHIKQSRINEALVGAVEEFSEIERKHFEVSKKTNNTIFHESASLISLHKKGDSHCLTLKYIDSDHKSRAKECLRDILVKARDESINIDNVIVSNHLDSYVNQFEKNLLINSIGLESSRFLVLNNFSENLYSSRIFSIFHALLKQDNYKGQNNLIVSTSHDEFSAVLVSS
jgi:Beta-ketoacyl synthase, N-terminal domain